MTLSPLTYDAVISAPEALPSDLTSARYDAKTNEIVVTFKDNKVVRVPTSEFAELASATAADYEFLEGTRAGVTCLSKEIDFAVAADWWREQAG
ncbi:hypothetical protein [cf. Phormidesmis sp. LEGE 11477]|uniref:hypothetical protein n=1 Tax=cf. Phormidesmis sp. LEGE 11477 TaxID=1828680 RepID=UPI00187ED1E0|nr:hypothetical protein [cf. Phormidesmis sp. LEGE 11477]MBE9060987.1 hypothetical protein [cf. Phormidesmis sp. LEGE 11477]